MTFSNHLDIVSSKMNFTDSKYLYIVIPKRILKQYSCMCTTVKIHPFTRIGFLDLDTNSTQSGTPTYAN